MGREGVGPGMGKSDLKMRTEELNTLGIADYPNSPPGVCNRIISRNA